MSWERGHLARGGRLRAGSPLPHAGKMTALPRGVFQETFRGFVPAGIPPALPGPAPSLSPPGPLPRPWIAPQGMTPPGGRAALITAFSSWLDALDTANPPADRFSDSRLYRDRFSIRHQLVLAVSGPSKTVARNRGGRNPRGSREDVGRIRVAIAGVGNCASALVQGVEYYRRRNAAAEAGLMARGDRRLETLRRRGRRRVRHRPAQGRAARSRKRCSPRRTAHPALPALAVRERRPGPDGPGARRGRGPHGALRRVGGVPARRRGPPGGRRGPSSGRAGRRILVCYLRSARNARSGTTPKPALDAGVALVNCVPVFLASDSRVGGPVPGGGAAPRGRRRQEPDRGDDRAPDPVPAARDRGVAIDRTYQLNTGGNTDFLNMLERSRLQSKKKSKTESVQSQLDERLEAREIHIGPSDYVPWQDDNKVAFIRLEGRGFGGAPLEIELRMSVQDCAEQRGSRHRRASLHRSSGLSAGSPGRSRPPARTS